MCVPRCYQEHLNETFCLQRRFDVASPCTTRSGSTPDAHTVRFALLYFEVFTLGGCIKDQCSAIPVESVRQLVLRRPAGYRWSVNVGSAHGKVWLRCQAQFQAGQM